MVKAQRFSRDDVSEQEVCTIFCARLDATALGALLNVLVFGLKQLISTIVYRGQLLVINTQPQISFSVEMDLSTMHANSPNAAGTAAADAADGEQPRAHAELQPVPAATAEAQRPLDPAGAAQTAASSSTETVVTSASGADHEPPQVSV